MVEELIVEADTEPRNRERGNSKLLEHIYDSYNWLRIGLAVTALAFPILLWTLGKFVFGLPLQDSMSAYYWATPDGASPGGDPPLRVLFVGLIFAIGSFLFLYKGYSLLEELALDAAAIFLILVALVPKCGSGVGQCPSWSVWHGRFAILFFILIALVAIWDSFFGWREAQASTYLGPYRFWYGVAGTGMIALPVGAIVVHYFLGRADTLTFWLELAGICGFVIYWSFKTRELRKAVADRSNLHIDPGKRFLRGRES
jgi:hypothetical protein